MSHSLTNPHLSIEQKYLDFTATTNSLFAHYPQLEPLRSFVFKQLLVQRRSMGWRDSTKHWLRPYFRSARTSVLPDRADMLIFVEGQRPENINALLPIYNDLISRGLEVRFVSLRGPSGLPPSTVHFQASARAIPPAWAKDTWDGLCDLLDGLHDRALKRSFYYECASAQALFDEMRRILDASRPKAVLVRGTQQPGETALVVTARRYDALTLLMQHGIITPLHIPVLTDYMLTWGESSTETLAGLGVSRTRLVALGSPLHDSIPSVDRMSARRHLLGALSLPDRPIFIFFSNGNDLVINGCAPIECASWLESTASQYSGDINIVVRLHPNEDGLLYRGCSHLRITKGRPDLGTTLHGCDWVGSFCSTVLLEALLYKKPVWQFHAEGWPELVDNWRRQLAVRVSSQASLNKSVGNIISQLPNDHSPASQSLLEHVFANRGQATQAVSDFVQLQLGRVLKTIPLTNSSRDFENAQRSKPTPIMS